MKKRVFALAATFLLLLFATVPVLAQETEYFVYDVDGYLGTAAAQELNDAAAQLSAQYGCGIYAAVFNDMTDYGYYDIESFAEAVYTELELGYSEQNDGILLVLSMAERDYDLTAYGDFGNYAFTDYGKSVLADEFLDNFRDNDWAGGFSDYINASGRLLSYAAEGEPLDMSYGGYDDYDYDVDPRYTVTVQQRLVNALPAGGIVGVIVGIVYCSVLKRKMKSARAATEADRYVCEHGVDFRAVVDQFSHTTVVRQHIDRDSGSRSGGGGGGTHINSSGFSHSSGKF